VTGRPAENATASLADRLGAAGVVPVLVIRDASDAIPLAQAPMGGVRMLQALAGPYPGVRFVPTGGIGLASLDAYLRLPNVVACGGSWMATPDQISAHDWEEIGIAGRDTVRAVSQARTDGGNDG
jgi:2-dehydro-3-deoxyphosphogluconate aldolase/(4S)-4-hydroxy-2-oxoglutarate aldolase